MTPPVKESKTFQHYRPNPSISRSKRNFRKLKGDRRLTLEGLGLLLLLNLEEESSVDVRQHATIGNCRADKSVEFFVSTNGKLKVARRNTLHLEILCGILRKSVLGSEVSQRRDLRLPTPRLQQSSTRERR